MSYTVNVRHAAERDVVEAQHWYEQQRAGLAAQFHDEFARVIGRLAETPLIYPVAYQDVRRAVLQRFPFLIWYRLQGSAIAVLACTHGKLDQAKVFARLR